LLAHACAPARRATASIDPKTDALVQAAILKLASTNATIITIAHRLQTIADSDRIVVMDQGRVAQFGAPAALMADTAGPYFAMALLAGGVPLLTLKNCRPASMSPSPIIIPPRATMRA